MTYSLPLREELRSIEPYGAPQLDVPVLLNVNENPYPPSTAVIEDIAASVAHAAAGLNRYPDRDAVELRSALAAYLVGEARLGDDALDHTNLWAANGSNEVMLHLFQAFGGPGRTALSFAPTYSMYPEYARDTHTGWVLGQRESDFTLRREAVLAAIEENKPSLILFASPNNPSGTALPLDLVREVCEASDAVVVIDEAYAEFRRDGTPSAATLLDRYPNLAVSRTMSKAFALAGARLGYLAASPELVRALQIVRLPYHLSAVTQATALAALRHSEELLGRVAELRAERDATVSWLRGLGLTVADTDSNFALFGTFADRHAVWQGLLDRGVLIREVGPEGWLRVTIGSPDEMSQFRNALTEVLNND